MEQLYRLSLREMAAGVRERRFDASALMRSCLARIAARDPEVQAWAHLDPERAITRAEAARADHGPLHGAPVAVKDIIDVAGMPTRYGSPIYASAGPAAASAECVAALEAAGAIVVGKSVTTEFAYYTPGKTRNPWNASHTPGGSSMGSAASVACGMVAGALGTQTNGSVIRPAAFCGVVGFKPTQGAVSNHGTLDPWPTLDHTGVFARSVGDAALLASVIAGLRAIAPAVVMPSHAPRLALVRTPVWHMASAAQREMLEKNGSLLGHAGARVEEIALPAEFEDAHRMHRVIMGYEAARHFGELRAHHRDLMSSKFDELLEDGFAIGEPEYSEALRGMESLRKAFASFMPRFDAIITPPAAGEAPPTLTETGSPAFCTIWTLLGVPTVTIPVGVGPAGLPLGLQIVGAHGADEGTLGVAGWCEAHLPFHALQ